MIRSFPLATSPYRIGTISIVTLVALRLVIGWHFYREGADKIIQGDWSASPFMVSATGPLAPLYQGLVWDMDGRARLDKEAALERWDQYRQRVVDHYRFDEQQAEQAQRVYDTRRRQLEWFFNEYEEDLDTYFKGVERWERNRRDAARQGVTSLRGQSQQIERELQRELVPLLATTDKIRTGYQRDLHALATPEQARRGTLALPRPGRQLMDTVFIDSFIPYFDVVVGAMLILGLFTRVAALAGAGFLAGIVLTQWPWAPGAVPTHYQVIEMFALLVIAATGAGRFAGLDYFTNLLWRRCCAPKTENEA